mmetsp:Transcript_17715/g.32025  ORF Transcript_17715/g.32025 Transcript_17715/m.32025 type:complete len:87 (+) Transcript_17715:1816-2076(+)
MNTLGFMSGSSSGGLGIAINICFAAAPPGTRPRASHRFETIVDFDASSSSISKEDDKWRDLRVDDLFASFLPEIDDPSSEKEDDEE